MQTVVMIIKLLPVLIDAIKALEAAIPGQGKGAEKLAALRGILEATDATLGALWPVVERVVGVLVGAMNKTGALKAEG